MLETLLLGVCLSEVKTYIPDNYMNREYTCSTENSSTLPITECGEISDFLTWLSTRAVEEQAAFPYKVRAALANYYEVCCDEA